MRDSKFNPENLFWKLFKCNSEKEVDKVINSETIFTNIDNWQPYGGNRSNFGTFESQQNNPIPALLEKITNSLDATLIKECLVSGINPESKDAPMSMSEAVERFYNVKNGEIGDLTNSERRKLAENIQIIATGEKLTPSITIYDEGEGQKPHDFKSTFLSLHKGNKSRVQFVQGKYNMGSTGAVVFCGDKKYQLIASKRNTDILDNNDSELGFTLVRKHVLNAIDKDENVRSTWYEYFCIDDKVPSFKINTIDLGLYGRKFTSGSITKLYSYQLPRGSKGEITTDLYRDFNQYFFHLPIPILVYETREHYKKQDANKVVLGNRTRINNDAKSNVEKQIQYELDTSWNFKIPINVVIFKSSVDHREFIKNKCIIYTMNGQLHASEGQSFISQELALHMLKKIMLIQIDCTDIPTEYRQDLFMSNRTHLKQGLFTEQFRDQIINLLSKSKELKIINADKRRNLLKDTESDEGLIENLLSKLPVDRDLVNILRNNGSLDFLKKKGNKINNANPKENQNKKKKLNRFPSVFQLNLKKDKSGKRYKTIPINQTGKATIDTDVSDDYLFRPVEKGTFKIQILQKKNKSDFTVNPDNPNQFQDNVTDILTINREGPVNGTIKLLISPNEKARVGDEVEVHASLSSPGNDYTCVFNVKVDQKISKPNAKNKEDKPTETFPNLPEPVKINKEQWDNEGLGWGGYDIVKVITDVTESNDIIVDKIMVNMDAFVLINFISKNRIKTEKEIKGIRDKYLLTVYLHSLFLFSIIDKMKIENDHIKSIEIDEFISDMIKPYTSFLLYENWHIEKMAWAE
jgi:hypothetical protein